MSFMNDIAGMVLISGSLAAVLVGLKWWQREFTPHPEIVRKILHVLMGCLAMTFPFLFKEDWPVWTLAALTSSALAYLKARSKAAAGLASVFCAVERPTHGELCFALGVAALFSLSHGNLALYLIPMFILTMSDALAALAGLFLGHLTYSTLDGHKTAEGSLAFFLSAWTGTTILLTILCQVSLYQALLTGLLLGCLATLCEAVAWHGLDNLFVPLSSFIMLKIYLGTDTATLLIKIAVSLLLLAVVIILAKSTKLNDSAVLGAGLFSYLSWALGGCVWLMAPLTVFVLHKSVLPAAYRQTARKHSIYCVLSVAAPGFFWLFLAKAFNEPALFFLYTLSYAAHMAVIAIAHLRQSPFRRSDIIEISGAVLRSWILLFAPFVVVRQAGLTSLAEAMLGLFAILFAVVVFRTMPLERQEDFQGGRRWARQLAVVTVSNIATILVLVLAGSLFV